MDRTKCDECREATAAEVEQDYIGDNKLAGPRDLTNDDHAAIMDRTMRLLEEDRGIACPTHYFDEEA